MTNGPDDPQGKLPEDDDNPDQTRIRPNPAKSDASGDRGAESESGKPDWEPPAWEPPAYGGAPETAPYGAVPPPPPPAGSEAPGAGAEGDQAQPPQDPYAQAPYAQEPYAQSPYAQDPYAQAGQAPYPGYDQYQQGGYGYDQSQQPYGYGAAPYGYGPAPYGSPKPPSDSGATTSMILGIIGLASIVILCGIALPLSPFAMVMGMRAKRRIQAAAGQLGGEGQAQAGFWTGLIGTILLVLGIVGFAIFMAIGLSGGFDSDPTYDYDYDDDF